MDVGLNNKNFLSKEAPEFNDVVFLVKATNCEQFTLWQEYSKESLHNIEPFNDIFISNLENNVNWNQSNNFFLSEIKKLNDKLERTQLKRVNWKQINAGFTLRIGWVEEKPVALHFSFAIINGKKICFYECTSRMADNTMIEKWLIERFQLTHDGYCRWNHTNATNFHICTQGLDSIDLEPRDTVYNFKN